MKLRERRSAAAAHSTVALLLLAGCASPRPEASGFLRDYGALAVDGGDESFAAQHANPARLANYPDLAIEPVRFFGPAFTRSDDPEALERLKDLTKSVIERKLAAQYRLVPPGPARPRTLVLRVAITEVQAARPALNALSSAAIGVAMRPGGLKAEVEAIDSLTSERLAALTWAGAAPAVSLKPREVLGGFRRYRHAELQAEEFAAIIGELLWKTGGHRPQVAAEAEAGLPAPD